MKWGVRRYQNYDGTYTKAGMKRYNSAMDVYDKRLSDYKKAKNNGLKGDSLKLKKAKVKEAKRDVQKHYKHLKLDKYADQGKILYANGRRISYNNSVSNALAKVGGLSLAAAAYNYKFRVVKNDIVTKALAGAGGLLLASSGAKRVIDHAPDNKLRAYYSHTSNY